MKMIYKLHIDAYTPKTIPMARLAEYMREFAAILGHEHAVHFSRLKKGSTQLLSTVEAEGAPKVRQRVDKVRRGEAPPDIVKHLEILDRQLADDNAVGALYEEQDGVTAEIYSFPGRTKPKPIRYGPFNQEGNLDGVLISIGGVDKTISLQLQNGDIKYTGCETNRDLARQLAKHLFEPIRIQGTGRWIREEDGNWNLVRFRVKGFEVLRHRELKDAIQELRDVKGSGWRELEDPTAELARIRRGEGELH